MKSTEAIRPLLLLVDDEPAVLSALEAELQPKFGGLCRIETYQHPEDVIEALERWSSEGRSVALAIVDQRMPGITGVELLKKLRESALQPGARSGGAAQRFSPAAATRTVLLTGFGGPGVEAAAKSEGQVHRYREKPWSGEELAKDVGDLLGEFWNDVKRESHPAYREFVSAKELRDLWSRLEVVNPPAPSGGATSGAEADPQISEALWASLGEALRGQESAIRPGAEALTAFLLGTESDEQRAEVRRAALASTTFRRELLYLMGQIRRLEGYEARTAFDETVVPEWVRRLAKRGEAG